MATVPAEQFTCCTFFMKNHAPYIPMMLLKKNFLFSERTVGLISIWPFFVSPEESCVRGVFGVFSIYGTIDNFNTKSLKGVTCRRSLISLCSHLFLQSPRFAMLCIYPETPLGFQEKSILSCLPLRHTRFQFWM